MEELLQSITGDQERTTWRQTCMCCVGQRCSGSPWSVWLGISSRWQWKVSSMARRVWNSPRVEPSMKAWRVEDTEDRERHSTSSPGEDRNRGLTLNSICQKYSRHQLVILTIHCVCTCVSIHPLLLQISLHQLVDGEPVFGWFVSVLLHRVVQTARPATTRDRAGNVHILLSDLKASKK